MNSSFYITLKRIGFSYTDYPQAGEILTENYNDLQLLLIEYTLKQPEVLKNYCIHAFNQISEEQKRIIEIWDYHNKKELKRLDQTELKELQYELDYYHDILTLIDDTKEIVLEHLVAYYPEKYNKHSKTLSPFNIIRKAFTDGTTKESFLSAEQKEENQKPVKYKADEYALAYIFDLYANNQQVPINRIEGGFNAKKIKEDSSKFPDYDKTPDAFYRAVKKVLGYDLNKPADLQNISKDWLNAVCKLSNNWVTTRKYLKDKNLIME